MKANDDIKIKVFGYISDKDKLKFKYYKNIHFYGFIDYDSLIKETYNADALLHIEGFSEYYIKDCRYAFSTKISDYIMINKPFIVYGPKEISGVRFYSKIQPDWCFTSKKELCSLSKILKTNEYHTVNLDNLFSSNAVSKKIEDIINKL